MKKFICVIMLLGMALSAFGCATKERTDASLGDAVAESGSVIEEESSMQEKTAEEICEEVYYNKLDYIYGCVMGSALDYETLGRGAGGIIYASYGKEKEEALNSIGYMIGDINGDSFPELVIGSMDKSLPGTELYTIYQVNEEQTRTLCWIMAEPRTKVMYMQDGGFYFNQEDPASREYSFGVLNVYDTDTYLGCTEYYFLGYDPLNNSDVYYRNTLGWFDIDASEKLDFTDEDFINKDNELQQQCAHLELTPLAEYTPSDSKFTKQAEVENSESNEPMLNVMLAEGVRDKYPNRVEHPVDCEDKIDVLYESVAPLKKIGLLYLYATGMNENGEIIWTVSNRSSSVSDTIIEPGSVVVYPMLLSESYPEYGYVCVDEDGNNHYYAVILTEDSVSLQEIKEKNVAGESFSIDVW